MLGSRAIGTAVVCALSLVATAAHADGEVIGWSWTDCTLPTVNDVDQDGLDDVCEAALAHSFQPTLVFHQDEAAGARRPHWSAKALGSGVVRIFYALSYELDPGDPQALGMISSHKGDPEFIVLDVSFDSGGAWVLDGGYLSQHYRAAMSWSDGSFSSSNVNIEWAGPVLGRPVVYVAHGKHANYLSVSACDAGGFVGSDQCSDGLRVAVFGDSFPDTDLGLRGAETQPIDMVVIDGNREWYWTEKEFCGWLVSDLEGRSDCADIANSYSRQLADFMMVSAGATCTPDSCNTSEWCEPLSGACLDCAEGCSGDRSESCYAQCGGAGGQGGGGGVGGAGGQGGSGGLGAGGGGGQMNPSGALLAAASYGTTAQEESIFVHIDDNDDVVLAGTLVGGIDFGGGVLAHAGGKDVFTVQLDNLLSHLVSSSYGSSGDQSVRVMDGDVSGVFSISGGFNQPFTFGFGPLSPGPRYIAGLSHTMAAPIWSSSPISSGTFGVNGIASSSTGETIAAAYTLGAVTVGANTLVSAGGYDVVVAKYDAGGTPAWAEIFGDANNEQARDVAFDSSGNVFVVGYYHGNIVFKSGVSLTGGTNKQGFLTKMSADGQQTLWALKFDANTGEEDFRFVETDNAGNVYVAGTLNGTIDIGIGPISSTGAGGDFLLFVVDAGGSVVRQQLFAPSVNPLALGLSVNGSGEATLCGSFRGTMNIGSAMVAGVGNSYAGLLVKLDAAGAPLWTKAFANSNDVFVRSCADNSAGAVVAGGLFSGSLFIENTQLTSAGMRDFFVATFEP